MRLRRKPPKGNVRRVTSINRNLRGVLTNEVGQTVQFESFEERILSLQFQRDRSVKDFRSQPFTFTFTDEDKRERKYTPDFVVWRSDNSIEIHEVTLTERRERSRSREREQAAQKICQEKGWKYVVHTEHTLPVLAT
jgi:TnsA endonuclease N terminal